MRAFGATILESLLVVVLGALLALAANAVSPLGLHLARDYFPRVSAAPVVPAAAIRSPGAGAGGAPAPAGQMEDVRRRLERSGLRVATGNEAIAWFRDAGNAPGLTVFVDARDDAQFASGHIPEAWQFNHYRPEIHLPAVLPVCLAAIKVVVYCTGGQCEDSEFAAMMLRDAGVPAENLFVYPGGITEWKANRQPVEIGARRSGNYLQAPP